MKEYRHYGVVYLQHCKCENISFFYLWCKVEKLCVFLHLCIFKHDWHSLIMSLVHSWGVDLLKLANSSKPPMFFSWLIINNLVTISVIIIDFSLMNNNCQLTGLLCVTDFFFLLQYMFDWLNFLFCVSQCNGSSSHSDLFHVLRSAVLSAEGQDGRLCWQGSRTGGSSCQRWAGH